MVLSLLVGNILLVAVAVSYPMYRNSSFQRMLTDEFENYREKNAVWPAVWGQAIAGAWAERESAMNS